MGDLSSTPGLGKSPGEEKGYPLSWPREFHGSMGSKSQTWLSDFHFHFHHLKASLIAQLVKNLPAMQETLVLLLGQEDLLEKE